MHEIDAWLKNGKQWGEGMLLLSKYGTIASVYSILAQAGETKPTKAKLENSLRNILAKTKAVAAPVHPAPVLTVTEQPAAPQADALEVAALTAQVNAAYSEMGVIHARILATDSQTHRASLYQEFLAKQRVFAELAHRRDHLQEYGTLPEPVIKKVTNAKHLPGTEHAELMLLRSKVSRAINEQIPAYRCKTGEKWRKKLERRLEEVEQWKARIAELEKCPNNG